MDQKTKDAYRDVLATPEGMLVFKDLLEQFRIVTGVYAFQQDNNLADLAYRDGQRNCGIYIYSIISQVNPARASELNKQIFEDHLLEMEKIKKVGEHE